jgi:CDP-diacylglycerol--glycerol-3-phosphate 3-phosphatidyltransferase
MNLANKLTLLRVVMIPFFLLVLYLGQSVTANYLAAGIFIIASLTDFLDGYIARSQNLVTNFGKFMDPLADKLLVTAALIYFVEVGQLSAIIVIIIVSREFIISGFRLVAAMDNKVIAASIWGKIKTFTTMIMIIVLLFNFEGKVINIVEIGLVFFATLFTILSAFDYIVKNISIFHE